MIVRRISFPDFGWRSTFTDLERMRRDMDRLFEQVMGGTYRPLSAGVFPLINLTEDKDNYYVRAELPGLKAEALNISASGRNLTISGERKISSKGDNVKYNRREREAGSFNRIIALPGDIEVNKVEANLSDGILTVAIPKAEAAKPKQIMVK
ncbi:MAG: Hsp20/alpha crystallin family protein [Deltaproteobacteria bacterium]|nr:MAG: Hsp20/alpha crystallin family protein [Deltaproteobacteria bacterium]